MLKDILIYLGYLVEKIGPIGITIATFVESLIAPIPSEIILVFTGTSLKSLYEIFIYTIAATAGSYLGTLPFYVISYKSKYLIYKIIEKYGRFFFITREDIDKAEAKFKNNGRLVVFTGRLIPGIRSLISIPAGISRMGVIEYTIYTLAGSFSWNLLLISCGYLLKDQYKIFLHYLDVYEKLTYAILILICILTYLLLFKRHRKQK